MLMQSLTVFELPVMDTKWKVGTNVWQSNCALSLVTACHQISENVARPTIAKACTVYSPPKRTCSSLQRGIIRVGSWAVMRM
jgi:hypothetical protein